MSINRPVLLSIAGAGAVVAGALAVPAWRHLQETVAPPLPALHLALALASEVTLGAGSDHPFGLALAPDGRRLAIPAASHGATALWLRDLTTNEMQPLPGTDGGVMPFWSPDGRELGFFAGGRLKKISLENRQIADLAAAPSPRGGTWHARGDIVFAPEADGGLARRAPDGSVSPFTTVDSTAGETAHRFPVLLDDGRHVLFFVRASQSGRSGVWIAPIERPDRRTRLASSDASAAAAGGMVVYASEDALIAQQIEGLADGDAKPSLVGRGTLIGRPVGRSALNQLAATAAGDVIVFGAPEPQVRELKWMTMPQLAPGGLLASGAEVWDVRIAPRGNGVAVTQTDPQLGTLDVFVYDGPRPVPRKISQAIDVDDSPVWSADATRIAWVTGRRTITVRGAQAELPDQPLAKFDAPVRLWDWSRDGRYFVVGQSNSGTRDDLLIVAAGAAKAAPLPMSRDTSGTSSGGALAPPSVYAQTPFNETQAAIAPDGRWLAFTSDESGRPEIYVDSFPMPGHRSKVTSSGGSEPRWAPGGDKLLFRRGSELHVVTLAAGGTTRVAASSTLLVDAGADIRAYDVSPDGQRVLLNLPAPKTRTRPITVVVHWRSLLGLPGQPSLAGK